MAELYAIQFDIIWEDKAANHHHLETLLDQLQPEPGSLILLPEMFDVGFSLNTEKTCEESTNFASEKWCARIARQYDLFLQGASIRQPHDHTRKATNNTVVFNPAGELVCRYEKLVPFTGGRESEKFEAGQSLVYYDWNGLRVCPFICYDLRFPELWRMAVKETNCDMFTCSASWPAVRQAHWRALLTARAIENQAFVAGVNRTGHDPYLHYAGGSIILDPMGNILSEADGNPQILHTNINVQVVREWREKFTALDDLKHEWLGHITP